MNDNKKINKYAPKPYLPRKQICKDYLTGDYSMLKLGKKYNCSDVTIKNILIQNNIKPKGRRNDLNILDIIDDYTSGMTIKQLENKYDCSNTTIFKLLKNNNIKIRSVGESQKGKLNHQYNLKKEKNPKWKGGNFWSSILYKYKLTRKEYISILKKQKGKCVICNDKESRLVVDHCHKTGKVRGLLCDKCNRGLGQFNDDINKLKKAIMYLKNKNG